MKFRALLAEFIGTFALIFVGVLVIQNMGGGDSALIGIALAHGLTIACLASATAAISGGHLNPAVTFGMLLTRRIDLVNAVGYMAAQFLGGIAAGYAAVFVTFNGTSIVAEACTPSVAPGITTPQALVAEAIATFFLVFVILGTAVDRRAPKMGALFIGLTVTIGIFAIGPMTGAALNPARWLGSAVPGGAIHNAGVYLAGPALGAAAAALIYTLFLEDKLPLAPQDPVRVDPQG
jgi:MIP family channel proteins